MMKINRKLLLINLISFLLLLEVLIAYVFKEFNIMTLSRYSIINQDEFRLSSSETQFDFSDDYKTKFQTLIKNDFNNLKINEHTIEEAIKLREHLLNLGRREKNNYLTSRYPDDIYLHLKSNGNLLCGEVARLYGYVLNLYGFKVRYLTFARSIFDSFDRHSTIEIWDEKRNKWIISDPTFNISFKCDTIFLSSDELYDLIHSGNFNSINAIHGNITKYELPIEQYYISYYSLLNNIYFIKHIEPFKLSELPPIRWLDSKYRIYLLQTIEFPVRGSSLKIQNSIIFFILFLNPLLIILLSLRLILLDFKYINSYNKLHFISHPALVKILRHFKA